MVDFNALLQNQNLLILIGAIGAIIYFAFKMGKKSASLKPVNRPEIIKKKLISIMKNNKSKFRVLEQKDNVIGITSNMAFYLNDDDKKIYVILWYPKWLWKIPKFWKPNIMAISEEFIKDTTLENKKYLNFGIRRMQIGTTFLKSFVINDDLFIDKYFELNMNLGDEIAMNFLKTKLLADESELSSSIFLAQGLRLSSVDFSKAYQPTISDIEREKIQEAQNIKK